MRAVTEFRKGRTGQGGGGECHLTQWQQGTPGETKAARTTQDVVRNIGGMFVGGCRHAGKVFELCVYPTVSPSQE